MIEMSNILAKSLVRGGTDLLTHTQHVVTAIKVFVDQLDFDFDIDLAIKGAVLHDLGKAHPHFQKKIHKVKPKSLLEQREWDYIHRHEISSIAFLPAFPKENWNILIELVVAHHKSIENDKSCRGIIDLEEHNSEAKNWINKHLYNWDEWSQIGLQILNEFGYYKKNISLREAEEAIEYTLEYCLNIEDGWSAYRGLLMSADHFASAYENESHKLFDSLFNKPDLSFYRKSERKSELYPLSMINIDKTTKHTLVVAPTGAGKTDFLLNNCSGRIFYTLPYQASINAMYSRIKNDIYNENKNDKYLIRVLHSTSALQETNDKTAQSLQHFGGAGIKICTPHQLAAIVFGTIEYESLMLDLKGCDIIFDEIHTYTAEGRAMVLNIIKTLLRLDCKLHIGTATMPTLFYKRIRDILNADGKVSEIRLTNDQLNKFNRHIIHKLESDADLTDIISSAINSNEKLLIIHNTVARAQDQYNALIEKYPNMTNSIMLIHSRYRRKDRKRLEDQLTSEFEGNKNNDDGLRPCIVVATQVVEVSLDISFDRMITEVAPFDALIQRFGRVNRKRSDHTIEKYKPIHVVQLSGSTLPYDKKIVARSWDQLDNGKLLKETDIQSKIDKVYTDQSEKNIDIHFIYVDGKYKITKLNHKKSAVIIDALNINSATCILRCDREKYIEGKWADRIKLEIPINVRSMYKYKNMFEQLECGSNPFVIEQDESQHKLIGLILKEPEILY